MGLNDLSEWIALWGVVKASIPTIVKEVRDVAPILAPVFEDFGKYRRELQANAFADYILRGFTREEAFDLVALNTLSGDEYFKKIGDHKAK